MRKKVMAFLLASAMVFSTVACGGGNQSGGDTSTGDRSMYPGTTEEEQSPLTWDQNRQICVL